MSHLLLNEFARSDSSDMVAAALSILAKLADDAEKRHRVVAPWAWDLRLRARQLEKAGRAAAAAQARVIARMVGAVALGQISGAELRAAAADVEVNIDDFRDAVGLLESAMRRDVDVSA